MYVVVQQANGHSAPDYWSCEAPDAERLGVGEIAEWRRLCRLIVDWAHAEPLVGVEVFLCLVGDELILPPDRNTLKRLLTLARNHTWGAKLYLVTSRKSYAPNALLAGKVSWERWMEWAVAGRALDVVQLDYPQRRPAGFPGKDLRRAADLSDQRYRELAACALPAGTWRCVMAHEQPLIEDLLSSMVQYPEASDQAQNLVVVVDSLLARDQVALVRRARRRFPGRCRLVAALRHSTPQLREYCASMGLPNPIDLQGVFELWYLLMRLGDRSRLFAERDLNPRVGFTASDGVRREPKPWIRKVPLDEEPVFDPATAFDLSEILITSSFNARDKDQCREAAEDVGQFLEHAPLGLRFLVEPAVTLGRLVRAAEHHRDLQAWIHLGHGTARGGLEEASTGKPGTGRLASPDRWLDCFRVQRHKLCLAMFLTCHSSPIADRFARAGAGATLGFQREVESDMCRELAVEVLKAAFVNGTSPGAILFGFQHGYYRLVVQQTLQSEPVVFLPERP